MCPSTISRRSLAAGAAWSVPIVAVSAIAPAYATSPPDPCPPEPDPVVAPLVPFGFGVYTSDDNFEYQFSLATDAEPVPAGVDIVVTLAVNYVQATTDTPQVGPFTLSPPEGFDLVEVGPLMVELTGPQGDPPVGYEWDIRQSFSLRSTDAIAANTRADMTGAPPDGLAAPDATPKLPVMHVSEKTFDTVDENGCVVRRVRVPAADIAQGS